MYCTAIFKNEEDLNMLIWNHSQDILHGEESQWQNNVFRIPLFVDFKEFFNKYICKEYLSKDT